MNTAIKNSKGSFTVEATIVSSITILILAALINIVLCTYDKGAIDEVSSGTVVFIENYVYNMKKDNNIYFADDSTEYINMMLRTAVDSKIIERYIRQGLTKKLLLFKVSSVQVSLHDERVYIRIKLVNSSLINQICRLMFVSQDSLKKEYCVEISDEKERGVDDG